MHPPDRLAGSSLLCASALNFFAQLSESAVDDLLLERQVTAAGRVVAASPAQRGKLRGLICARLA